MALTEAERIELEGLVKQLETRQKPESNTFADKVASGNKRAEKGIVERGDESIGEAIDGFKEAKGGLQKTMAGLNIAAIPFERYEAAVANAVLALQDGKASEVFKGVADGINGKKLGEFGDIARKAGTPEWASKIIGFGASLVSPIAAFTAAKDGLLATRGLTKFTDKGIKFAGKKLANGADEAVRVIGGHVDDAYKPINAITVDGIELISAFDDAPKTVINQLEKELGKSIDDLAQSATIKDARKIKQLIGELKPNAFGKDIRGVQETIDIKNINKTYAKTKQLIQKTLNDNDMSKQAEHLLKADEAFAETINASNFIKKAITESTLKKPTKAGKIAKGLKLGGDVSSREAINTLLKGGDVANASILKAIKSLNTYNHIVEANRIGGKVANYAILGGVAGSIGAKSARNLTGGSDSGFDN